MKYVNRFRVRPGDKVKLRDIDPGFKGGTFTRSRLQGAKWRSSYEDVLVEGRLEPAAVSLIVQ